MVNWNPHDLHFNETIRLLERTRMILWICADAESAYRIVLSNKAFHLLPKQENRHTALNFITSLIVSVRTKHDLLLDLCTPCHNIHVFCSFSQKIAFNGTASQATLADSDRLGGQTLLPNIYVSLKHSKICIIYFLYQQQSPISTQVIPHNNQIAGHAQDLVPVFAFLHGPGS